MSQKKRYHDLRSGTNSVVGQIPSTDETEEAIYSKGLLSELLEFELVHTQMAHKPVLRADVYARALRASQNVKRAEVWVGARST